MRILYHHRTRGKEAQGVHIAEMVRAFRALGHSVDFANLARRDETPDYSLDIRSPRWQRLVWRIPLLYELVQLAYNVVGIPFLLWKARRAPCDFIYERYSLFNFSGVIVAALLRKPLVLEVNAPLALEQSRDGHIRATAFARWSERTICNAAAHVIVVTDALRRILEANGVRPQQLAVMHNGVNLDHFDVESTSGVLRQRLGVEGKTLIGFVGWFRNWHGLPLLVDAFHGSGLSSRGVVLLLIGDGPMLKPLRRQVDRLGIASSVVFTGALPRASIPEHLALLDVAVLPAANEYCCPMKLLEYMALGKAVVAPHQPNVRELLCDDESAVLFPPGDASALAQSLGDLMANPLRVKALGAHARELLARRRFSWTGNAERVLALVSRSFGRRIAGPMRPVIRTRVERVRLTEAVADRIPSALRPRPAAEARDASRIREAL